MTTPVDRHSRLQRGAVHRHAARADQGRRSRAARRSTRRSSSSTTARPIGPPRSSRRCRACALHPAWRRTAARAGPSAPASRAPPAIYLIIQDADLEYDPQDYVPMLRGAARRARRHRLRQPLPADAGRHAEPVARPRISAAAASASSRWLFTGTCLTDTVTAFKLFRARRSSPRCRSRRAASSSITRSPPRMLARGLRDRRGAGRYHPRSKEEGKKIGLRDWFIGTRTFWRYRQRLSGDARGVDGRSEAEYRQVT